MEQKIVLQNLEGGQYFYDEAVKTLRTNIQFCGSEIKIVMLTSCIPGEGKSETSFALASSLADIGKKTLLIDGDIRKSVLVAKHGIKGKINGLTQYLSGQKKQEEVIYRTNVENLDLIAAGPYAPNPAELLEEKEFKDLLGRVRKEYDYVIIDTPPMSNLIDGAIVAKSCDGAVLVIESGAVSYRVARKVKEQLERSGCRILGSVINKAEAKNMGGYYNKYYKKAYDKYYVSDENAKAEDK